MPTGDILYRANVVWYCLGQNCMNSLFFRTKNSSAYADIPAEMSALHNQLGTFFYPPMRDMMSNQVQLISSTLVNLNGANFYEDIRTFVNVFGNVASAPLPSYCASVIGWFTQFRGRRVHGRTYIPGVPLSFQSGNSLTSAGQVALNNTANTILNNFSINTGYSYPFFVVFSRKNGTTIDPGPPPTTVYSPLAGVPVVRYVIDQTIFTQRHRLQGRGI